MNEHLIDEKRLFRRVNHSESVHFQFKDPAHFGGSLSCDLSEGGVRIRLNEFVPLHTELALDVRLRGEHVVHCIGHVVWIEKARFGDSYYAGLAFSKSDSLLMSQQSIGKFLYHQQHVSALK